MLKNHWRCGPTAWPKLGLRGFARSHNSAGVALQLLLVGSLIVCGLVALTDLAKFLETDMGMRLAAKHLVLLPLEPGTVAWVPCGYVCIPSALQTQQNKTIADMVHEVAFVWHLSVFNRTSLQELPEKSLGRHPDFQRPASLQSGFEASVGVEEGHSHKVCSSQELTCYCIFKSPRCEGEASARREFFERRRAIFAPAGFTLDSFSMCGNKCNKHGHSGCSCEENESKRDVACLRRCLKQVHVCFLQ